MAETPKLPGYNLRAIIETRNKILDEGGAHSFMVLTGTYFQDFVSLVHSVLPGVPRSALELSAGELIGRELTDERFLDFAWRIAGNTTSLRSGKPVLPWAFQAAPEWCPLRVIRATFGRNRKDLPGTWLTFQILAGSPCPMEVRRFWTRPQAKFVSNRLGYNRKAGRPYHGANHFVGMFLYGLFEPRLSEEKPGFHQVRVPDTMLAYNRRLIDGRRQRPCPAKGYHHPCEHCTLGYDACEFAIHPRTFYKDRCFACSRQDVLFDPDNPEKCVECTMGAGSEEK
jgi:hypothetical protein